MPSSVRSVRLRLFLLLLRAFLTVVLLAYLIVLGITGAYILFARNGQTFLDPPLFSALETYYLARGSWEGVEKIFASIAWAQAPQIPPSWENVLLLDVEGRVVADRGRIDTPLVGEGYHLQSNDYSYPLRVDAQTVGTLVIPREKNAPSFHILRRLLVPVAGLSILPGILALLIGILLTRRMVTPLADVITAAQRVAAGDFSTRVDVRGPQDLHALTEGFNQMAGTLERSDTERRNMLADVAHELRTPLSIIRGRLEGIVDGIYQPDEAHIARALEETYLLERLVDDLRLLTLAEARQLPFDVCATDLNELAARAVDLFGAQAYEKGMALWLETDPDAPPVVVDPQRVEQVIGNLVSNALHYTPENGSIALRITKADGWVECTVSDSGPGVLPADLSHLFDRFWRGEKSRARAAGGTGLGLAIARQLVEAQGGRVFARNLPEGGLQVGFGFAAKS
ncbi:MAG: HAMP domain-containing sensor histidine kinase [Chloroflexota bacterium]